MKRDFLRNLQEWKDDAERKPLLIQGARQVGKTWAMKEFGKTSFKNSVYINFENNEKMKRVFEDDMDIKRILSEISIIAKAKIEANETLLIFDEIQECNKALVSLKYFCENAPEYHIVAAGSFLGVAIHKGESFPVGKVDMLTLYPFTFGEFLKALGEEQLLQALDKQDWHLISVLANDFIKFLKYYFFIGGMPGVVLSFVKYKNFDKARKIQNGILENYKQDFSKHISIASVPKIEMIWDSVPKQLAKEKKKWVYNDMKEGARAREFEDAMHWLMRCGLIYQVKCVRTPNLPLVSYEEREIFKLYCLDIGLLSAMASLKETVFEPNNDIFSHFKGALTEQFVLQELKAIGNLPVSYYASEKGNAEVDFVIQKDNEIIPIEVKANINLKAKSLKTYIENFKPKTAIRASLANYSKNGSLIDIPLYALAGFLYNVRCIKD